MFFWKNSQSFQGKTEEDFKSLLAVNSVLPFLYKNQSLKTNRKFLHNLIPGEIDFFVRVTCEDFPKEFKLNKYQLLYGKIMKIVDHKMDVSIRVSDVWNKDFDVRIIYFF